MLYTHMYLGQLSTNIFVFKLQMEYSICKVTYEIFSECKFTDT